MASERTEAKHLLDALLEGLTASCKALPLGNMDLALLRHADYVRTPFAKISEKVNFLFVIRQVGVNVLTAKGLFHVGFDRRVHLDFTILGGDLFHISLGRGGHDDFVAELADFLVVEDMTG